MDRSRRIPTTKAGRGLRPQPIGETGNALISTLMITASLLPLGAFALMQARMDLLLQHHARDATEAFYVAESGLEHALADLARDPLFNRLLAGPDGIAGTADDHAFPFHAAPPPFFPSAPSRYEIEVQARSPGMVDVIARGFGSGTAGHALGVAVDQSAAAYAPGAIYSGADRVTLVLSADTGVSGLDRSGQDDPLPAIAVRNDVTADALRDGLDAGAAARLRGVGDTPSIAVTTFPEIETLAAAFASDSGTRTIGPAVEGSLGSGVAVCAGSLAIGSADGSGVLIIHGDLLVSGQFDFSGLLLVLGDVTFDRGSEVHLSGGLMQGPGSRRLHFLGSGLVSSDSQVLAQVDREFPGRLPRRASVAGWRELW